MASNGRYFQLDGPNANSEKINDLVTDLTDILTGGVSQDEPEQCAVILVNGLTQEEQEQIIDEQNESDDPQSIDPKLLRNHFELGEAGGGTKVQANHYEVVIGDGNNGACGGSYDEDQKHWGSFYIEHMGLYDGNDEYSKTSHYIYAQEEDGTSSTVDRYIFGAKYRKDSITEKRRTPVGCFMMVENGAFIKAKNGAFVDICNSSFINMNNASMVTLTQASELRLGGSGGRAQLTGEKAMIVFDGTTEYNTDGSVKCLSEDGVKFTMHTNAFFNMSRNSKFQMSDSARFFVEGGCLFKGDDSAEVLFEGASRFMIADSAEAYFEGGSFFMSSAGAKTYFESSAFFMAASGSHTYFENGAFFRMTAGDFRVGGPSIFRVNNDHNSPYQSSFGPIWLQDADSGRIFTNDGEFSRDFGSIQSTTFYPLSGHFSNLKYLMKKAIVESNGLANALSDRTYFELRRIFGNIDKIFIQKDTLFNIIANKYDYFSFEYGEKLNTALQTYGSSIRVSLMAFAKKSEYLDLIALPNFENDIKPLLTGTENYYFLSTDNYASLKTILGNDFDTYFISVYQYKPSELSTYTSIVTRWNNAHQDDVIAQPSSAYQTIYLVFDNTDTDNYFDVLALTEDPDVITDLQASFTYVQWSPTKIYYSVTDVNYVQTHFQNCFNNLDTFIDTTTHKFRDIAYYNLFAGFQVRMTPKATEKVAQNTTINIGGNADGAAYLQIAPNAQKLIDITILDGAQVELNGDARITITSKDLLYQYADSSLVPTPPNKIPYRYKAGITISFREGAYDDWTNTETIGSDEYCIPNDPDEIHFSIQDLKDIYNMLHPQT